MQSNNLSFPILLEPVTLEWSDILRSDGAVAKFTTRPVAHIIKQGIHTGDYSRKLGKIWWIYTALLSG